MLALAEEMFRLILYVVGLSLIFTTRIYNALNRQTATIDALNQRSTAVYSRPTLAAAGSGV